MDFKKDYSLLIKYPLFQGVSEAEFDSLVKCLGCTFKAYKKNETLHLAGDFVREIGMVVNGSVHIIKDDPWGNSNIIAEIPAGEMFAEGVVCGGVGILPVTVRAAIDMEAMFFDFQRMITTCTSACVFHTLLIRNMIGVFARKNIALVGKMEHLTQRTTRDKLLAYLSAQARQAGGGNFEIPFNRQELAEYLSVDRSAMSRELSKMQDEGILLFHRNHFELL